MAKHNDIKGALDFIRQGYAKGKSPFSFTVSDIMGELKVSERTAKGVLHTINTRAQFWRGDFPKKNASFTVSAPVYDRLTNWFD